METKRIIMLSVFLGLIAAITVFFFWALISKMQKENESNVIRQETSAVSQNESSGQDEKQEDRAPSAGEVKSLDGTVELVGENYLTVGFQYEETAWQSQVEITENTFLGTSAKSDNEVLGELTLNDFKTGSRVIVSSEEFIFKKDAFFADAVVVLEGDRQDVPSIQADQDKEIVETIEIEGNLSKIMDGAIEIIGDEGEKQIIQLGENSEVIIKSKE